MRFRRRLKKLFRPEDDERGAILILVAVAMVAFMGMAAFAVDLGWIYLQSTNVKKAAEAAALAAVTHMPLATPQVPGTAISAGLPPTVAAGAMVAEHGYAGAGTTVYRWTKASEVRVDISSSTNTFFLSFFGIDSVPLNRHAIAEQLPPLKLGSNGNRLGTNYDGMNLIDDEHYWLAINGEERRKQDGDPFSTRCTTGNGCSGTPNSLFRNPAYYYAVDVPAADVGHIVTVEVYDGSNDDGGFDFTDDLDSGGNDTFTFRLIAPDSTPGDPTDNYFNNGNSSICSRTYINDDGNDAWTTVCQFTPLAQGIHVLEVSVDGNDTAINGFSLGVDRASSVYGLGFMSLWMRDAGSSPTLQIVYLDQIYAGTQLIVNAFDLGDINGTALADVTFGGALAPFDCEVRVLDHNNNNPTSWGTDNSAGAPCKLTTKSGNSGGNQGIYNNEWVEFLFDIPADYTCSGAACWATVTYNFNGGNPTDRTTWGARINGTPIHLLDESTPLP